MLATLTVNDFKDKLQQSFSVSWPGCAQPVLLTLVEVQEQPGRGERPGQRQPFSLMLLGPPQASLHQDTYQVAAPGMPLLELFIVPLGPAPQSTAMRYQVLFN